MRYIVGIDEVGRGPLAGPITVGVVCIPAHHTWRHYRGLRDSKKLTERMREEWFNKIRSYDDVRISVASISAKTIDAIGIAQAGNRAARHALKKIGVAPHECVVQLDYGLAVEKRWNQRAYVKGDERFPAIALASICAKVTRDAYMKKMARVYPCYKFDIHKGYGTAMHRALIKGNGMSTLHRKSFCKNVYTI